MNDDNAAPWQPREWTFEVHVEVLEGTWSIITSHEDQGEAEQTARMFQERGRSACVVGVRRFIHRSFIT